MLPKKSNTKLGKLGEDCAVRLLKEKGYKILERNFRTKFGEIDIISQDKDTLVFVEVKTRSTTKYGLPSEAVDLRRIERIKNTGMHYQKVNFRKTMKVRIEVVSVIMNKGVVKDTKITTYTG